MDSPGSPGTPDRQLRQARSRLQPVLEAFAAAERARAGALGPGDRAGATPSGDRAGACAAAQSALMMAELALGDDADDCLVVCNALRLPIAARTAGLADGAARLAAWRDDPEGTLEMSRRVAAVLSRRAKREALYVLSMPEFVLLTSDDTALLPAPLLAMSVLEVVTYWPADLRVSAEGRDFLALALKLFSQGRVHDFSAHSMPGARSLDPNMQLVGFALECVLRQPAKTVAPLLKAAGVDALSLRALRRQCFAPLAQDDATQLRELIEDALGTAIPEPRPLTPDREPEPEKAEQAQRALEQLPKAGGSSLPLVLAAACVGGLAVVLAGRRRAAGASASQQARPGR